MRTWIRVASILIIVVMLSSSGAFAATAHPQAQASLPPSAPIPPQPDDPEGLRLDDGRKLLTSDDMPAVNSPQILLSTGGPDEFGYTWDDSVPLAWISASGGTDTGISSSIQYSGALNIGFTFKYYENSYPQLYVSRHGFVAFNNTNLYDWQSPIPDPSTPNDVIAPYWVPTDSANYVRYLAGGAEPNRYFVVEWNNLVMDDDSYTFEVILHENGDIVFQYGTITILGTSRFCETSGIEDSTGLDGLSITPFCYLIASNHAVRIYRPAVAARVNLSPLAQGQLTHAGATVVFPITIRNVGELGADTYDLTATSAWPTTLYAADGTTLLTDTDGDTTIDTGAIPQGGSVTIIAKLQVSGAAVVGDSFNATVTATSSLDTLKAKTATLQSAVPAPFAQIFMDSNDFAESLYLAKPGGQQVKKVTPDYTFGSYSAITELPNGNFFYAWSKGGCANSVCSIYKYDIEFTILNKYGETVRPVSKLTNNYGATTSTYERYLAAAVTPDGRVGVIWRRELSNSSQYQYNIYFAVLDSAGNVVYAPTNLTNNTLWGSSSTPNVPQFYAPRIAATADNRFALTWTRQYTPFSSCVDNDCYISDVYYSVRSSAGVVVKEITQFTNDTTGSTYDGYGNGNIASLTGSRVLLTWSRNSDGDIYYAVLDSAGNLVKDKTDLSSDNLTYDSSPDAAQLSDGKVVVGWSAYASNKYQIAYAVLDGTTYTRSVSPMLLNNPASVLSEYAISITPDAAGNAVLTWGDNSIRNLYYALVNGSGGVLTQPMIMHTAKSAFDYSRYGYASTTYSSPIATPADGAFLMNRTKYLAPIGEAFLVDVRFTNHGLTTATGVSLSLTLPTGLVYLGDSSGVTPVVSDHTYTWALPNIDLAFASEKTIIIGLEMPDSAILGTQYPLTLNLAVDGDSILGDNTFTGTVYAAVELFLPVVNK